MTNSKIQMEIQGTKSNPMILVEEEQYRRTLDLLKNQSN